MDKDVVWSNIPISYLKILIKFIQCDSLTECSKAFDLHIGQITKYFKQVEKHIGCSILEKKGRQTSASQQIKKYLSALEKFVNQLAPILAINDRLRLYFPVFIAHLFVKHSLINISLKNLYISSYSHALIRDYGLLAKQELNTYDMIYMNKNYEHLIDPNLWIRKYHYACPVKLYSTQEYLDLNPVIESPYDLNRHDCLSFSNEEQNEWIFTDKNGAQHSVNIDTDLIIDTTFIQTIAANEAMGIAKLEPAIVEYFQPNQLIPILTEYTLDNSEWVIYVKKDCQSPLLNECVNEMIQMLEVKVE